ncbi:MAG: hypothetical protein JSV00_02105 [bacterium]|nr:MAG: hypothetical protein JSV00_02105 [bacterium]
MVRALWLVILLAALYWALRQIFRAPPRQRGPSPAGGEEMVKDPQCGVYLPQSRAIERRMGGRRFYFCSRECERAYRKKGDPRPGT